jgi:hypothetical protein
MQSLSTVSGAMLLTVALAGCVGMPDLDPKANTAPLTATSPERAAAIAEMRAEAKAGDEMPFPDAFQAEQTARLAARGEPRSMQDVQAIQAELTLIADSRSKTSDAREIAALDARAKELRRLALAAGAPRE